MKFERLLESYLASAPRGLRSYLMAMPLWLGQKLWIADEIQRELATTKDILFGDHHESHAASAFYPSPFDEAAVLTIDGVGEWTTSSIAHGEGAQLDMLRAMRFPHSVGLLYSAFTYFTGFKVNEGEYKVMGLAPYGKPAYVSAIRDHVVDIHEDGSIQLNLEYFEFVHGLTMTGRGFERLFGGPARAPDSPVTQREMDLARSVQEIVEEVMLRMTRTAHRETGSRRLCLAGGVALNCVGNGRILREGPFEELWIQPAAGDAGGALGVAYALWHQYLGKPRVSAQQSAAWMPRSQPGSAKGELPPYADAMQGALLGPRFSDDEIGVWLRANGVQAERMDADLLAQRVAALIAEGKVIGLFQGRMEFGPRALGCRSIIGDARSPAMQSVLNLKIKFRESFRPFAPSILQERVQDWFETRPGEDSAYMLLVAPIREGKRLPVDAAGLRGIDKLKAQRSVVPAITHVDYSARIQTVDAERHGRYYAILKRFEAKTGCPVIINTSFNVRSEPIVCTPQDAYRCFMATNMDALVIENFL
ncbi:MAG: carbamoyltransferase family protein, partial [Longimicrobiales bacterium]